MNYSEAIQELYLMQQSYATLFTVTNKIQIQGDKYFDVLTSRQFMAIVAILHLPEDETTLNNIAKKLGTSKQNVNKLVSGIENKGYVVITPSERDKRAVNVKLTESGKQVALKCGEKAIKLMSDLFNDFTTEEVETLWTLLKKLYRFDGQEQDGFEENISLEVKENDIVLQNQVLKEFVAHRTKHNEAQHD